MFGIFKRLFRSGKTAEMAKETPLVSRKSPEEIVEAIQRIKRYPVKRLTQEEFNNLPRDVSSAFLMGCPIGTWFFCKPMQEAPDLLVVGQVVKGEDVLVEQFGAGLLSGTREREINRYLIEIV